MRTEVDVLEVTVDFLEDKITKTEVAPFKQPSPPNTSPCNKHHRRRRLPSHPPPPYRPLPQLIAGLIQAAGRPACKRALTVLGPQINYILHGDPLAEPHDYADPKYVGCEARHCMTADDLRKIDDGRAAEWTAAQSSKFTAKVAPISATRPRPRPDLALTLSLSPPAYAYHTFARTPSLYPPPPPPRRGANLPHERYRYERYVEKRAGRNFQTRSFSRLGDTGFQTSGAGERRSPEWPPLGCARSEGIVYVLYMTPFYTTYTRSPDRSGQLVPRCKLLAESSTQNVAAAGRPLY